jgi:glutamine synthetase
LEEATQKMAASGIAKEILGEKFTEHFIKTREWEWKQHLKAVTDWSIKDILRYI